MMLFLNGLLRFARNDGKRFFLQLTASGWSLPSARHRLQPMSGWKQGSGLATATGLARLEPCFYRDVGWSLRRAK
jgi:hypothetical protein